MGNHLIRSADHLPFGSASAPTWVNGYGTNAPFPGWSYDQSTSRYTYYLIPTAGKGTGAVTYRFFGRSAQTSGTVQMQVAHLAQSDGDAESHTSADFGTGEPTSAKTINSTPNGPNVFADLACSNLDGWVAGDFLIARVTRVTGGSLGGPFIMTHFEVEYADA